MGHKPENTLASIRKAIELGARCVEADVYLVDGHLVVFHDDRLERTTNGKGRLMEQSFDYLRSLDAGDGERIPTLEEVCDAVDSRAGLNIELKGSDTAAPVAELLAHLARRGYPKERFLVSSFDHQELVELRRRDSRMHLGVLIDAAPNGDIEFAADLGAFSIHPNVEYVDRPFIRAVQAKGAP
jgi:glycerophosphoryl diester phosphodiesterase